MRAVGREVLIFALPLVGEKFFHFPLAGEGKNLVLYAHLKEKLS